MLGIRFALLDAVVGGELPGMTPQRLDGIWGRIFQEYVLEILEAAFGSCLVRLAESKRAERADCLVIYPDMVLVVEIRGSHTKGRVHRGALSLPEREQELRKLRLPKAASQVAATIEDLRSFRIVDERLPWFDWTTTTVVPVIITYERLPLVWKLWPMYKRLTDSLQKLPLRERIAPVRFLSVGDVEVLPDLAQVADLGRTMVWWGNDKVTRERPLSQYLRTNAIEHAEHFRWKRVRESMRFLAEEIGLNGPRILEERN